MELVRDKVCKVCGLHTVPLKGTFTVCVCLTDPDEGFLRVWAVDPGEVHTGVSLLLVGPDDVHYVQGWEFKPVEWFYLLEELIGLGLVDVLVCEEFRLYPWLAREQGFSSFETAEAIGVVKHLARKARIPFYLQGASIKKMSIAVARGRGVPLKKFGKGKEDFVGKNQHVRDSMAHGYWWAFRGERSPYVLSGKANPRSKQSN